MTYLKDSYQKFLATPRSAPLAPNVSLIYVTSTTKVEGADAVASHASRQSAIVKKKSEQVISAIESSDSLCLDIETTLEFLEGGGAWLPSLDDNFLADRVVTIPTVHSPPDRMPRSAPIVRTTCSVANTTLRQVHIVHFNAEHQIQQVRIYWDQGSLLKEVEVIGARGRTWPIRDAKEQTRLLKSAASTKKTPPPLAPTQGTTSDLPARPASPGKRRIKDPYAADSLFDLLSPTKADAEANNDEEKPRPSSPGKRHTRDPYAAESLTELLSPSKPDTSAPVRPYAPSAANPTSRQYGELFVRDDEDETPAPPSDAEKVVAPKASSHYQGSRIFQEDDTTEDRAFYKNDPRKYNHFEIGGDNAELEVKEKPNRGKSRHQSQWDFSDFTTPEKPARTQPAEEARSFGYGDEGEQTESPPAKPRVFKPRRDAEVHFDMTDDNMGGDDGRIISSYQNRGQRLYQNRLFDDENDEAVPSEKETKHEPLSVVGNNANRKKDFDPHWEMTDVSPAPSKVDRENVREIPSDRAKSIKQMESSWDNYDQSPEPVRTTTALHNPARHNQPSWTLGDEE